MAKEPQYAHIRPGGVLTERQAVAKGLRPKSGETPELYWTNGYCKRMAYYYTFDQLEPATKDWLDSWHEQDRLQRNARRRELYSRNLPKRELHWWMTYGNRNGRRGPCTAWQWLAKYGRAVRVNARPHHIPFNHWLYYDYRSTYRVKPAMYRKLKAEYIKRYGGWREIDLEHTDYDGSTWY